MRDSEQHILPIGKVIDEGETVVGGNPRKTTCMKIGLLLVALCCVCFLFPLVAAAFSILALEEAATLSTIQPTRSPTNTPTSTPTQAPTLHPSNSPTEFPSRAPTLFPTFPTPFPTNFPTKFPTQNPTSSPSGSPTENPTIRIPTANPTVSPTAKPVKLNNIDEFKVMCNSLKDTFVSQNGEFVTSLSACFGDEVASCSLSNQITSVTSCTDVSSNNLCGCNEGVVQLGESSLICAAESKCFPADDGRFDLETSVEFLRQLKSECEATSNPFTSCVDTNGFVECDGNGNIVRVDSCTKRFNNDFECVVTPGLLSTTVGDVCKNVVNFFVSTLFEFQAMCNAMNGAQIFQDGTKIERFASCLNGHVIECTIFNPSVLLEHCALQSFKSCDCPQGLVIRDQPTHFLCQASSVSDFCPVADSRQLGLADETEIFIENNELDIFTGEDILEELAVKCHNVLSFNDDFRACINDHAFFDCREKDFGVIQLCEFGTFCRGTPGETFVPDFFGAGPCS